MGLSLSQTPKAVIYLGIAAHTTNRMLERGGGIFVAGIACWGKANPGGHSGRNGLFFLLANGGVVFVAIDATRFLILLCVNSLAILFGQVPVILRAHTALFPVDSGFLVFQT